MKQDNLRATPQPHGRPRKKSSLAAVGTAPSMEQRRGRAAALPRQCRRRRAPVPPTSCSKDTGASSQLRSFLVPRLVPAVRTRPTYVRELIEIFRRIDQIFSTAALKRYFRVRA